MPGTPRRRGSRLGSQLWLLTPETKLRRALDGIHAAAARRDLMEAGLPGDPNPAIADLIFDALDGSAPPESPETPERPPPAHAAPINTGEVIQPEPAGEFDPFEPPAAGGTPLPELEARYRQLQQRFVEHHAATERKCHDVYEAALRQREAAERRCQEATVKLLELRGAHDRAQTEIALLRNEVLGLGSQRELAKSQRDGVIAAQRGQIAGLKREVNQLLHGGEEAAGVAPAVSLALQPSEAQEYREQIQQLEVQLEQAAGAEAGLAEALRQIAQREQELARLEAARAELERQIGEREHREQMEAAQLRERVLAELMEELKLTVQAATRAAVAEAEAGLLAEVGALQCSLTVAERGLEIEQAEVARLEAENADLKRKRARDAERHKRAATAGAQAAAAALASEFSVLMSPVGFGAPESNGARSLDGSADRVPSPSASRAQEEGLTKVDEEVARPTIESAKSMLPESNSAGDHCDGAITDDDL